MNSYSKIPIALVIAFFLASCGSSKSKHTTVKAENYQLVWSDEFDYNGLPDSLKWAYDTEGNEAGWGNNEAQFYTEANEKNAWVENGVLHITFGFKGRLEIRKDRSECKITGCFWNLVCHLDDACRLVIYGW